MSCVLSSLSTSKLKELFLSLVAKISFVRANVACVCECVGARMHFGGNSWQKINQQFYFFSDQPRVRRSFRSYFYNFLGEIAMATCAALPSSAPGLIYAVRSVKYLLTKP